MKKLWISLALILNVSQFAAADSRCPEDSKHRYPDLAAFAECSKERSPRGQACADQLKSNLSSFYFVLLMANRAGQNAFETYSYVLTKCNQDTKTATNAFQLLLNVMEQNSPDAKLMAERIHAGEKWSARNALHFLGRLIYRDYIKENLAEIEMASMRDEETNTMLMSMGRYYAGRAMITIRQSGL